MHINAREFELILVFSVTPCNDTKTFLHRKENSGKQFLICAVQLNNLNTFQEQAIIYYDGSHFKYITFQGIIVY